MSAGLEQHVPAVYRFALRLAGRGDLAEDLAQETMLRAFRRPPPAPLDETAMRTWLFRITVNLHRDQLRRRRVRDDAAPRLRLAGTSADPPGHGAEQRDELAQALAALDALPQRQRDVLYLSACEQLSIAAIAEVLGIRRGAVKSSLSLARQRLREVLEPDARRTAPQELG